MPVGHISISDINDALPRALPMLLAEGKPVTAASVANARPTIEWPGIFITEYTKPMRNVLFDPVRDANPFFHYLEALWIIAGRNDVATLAHILPNMANYSDNGEVFHGAYGFRLRHWHGIEDSYDQIEKAIDILREKPDSRQVVMSIWNPEVDLGAVTKDMPCNDLLMFKVRDGKLNITVCNRSNDVIWGCYGANAVQFSMLQMYMAAKLGLKVGTYVQVSDSFHVYEDNPYWQRFKDEYSRDALGYIGTLPPSPYKGIGDMNLFVPEIERFDAELSLFWQDVEDKLGEPGLLDFESRRVPAIHDAACMYNTLMLCRVKDYKLADQMAQRIIASDWGLAADRWVARRKEKANA